MRRQVADGSIARVKGGRAWRDGCGKDPRHGRSRCSRGRRRSPTPARWPRSSGALRDESFGSDARGHDPARSRGPDPPAEHARDDRARAPICSMRIAPPSSTGKRSSRGSAGRDQRGSAIAPGGAPRRVAGAASRLRVRGRDRRRGRPPAQATADRSCRARGVVLLAPGHTVRRCQLDQHRAPMERARGRLQGRVLRSHRRRRRIGARLPAS